MNTKKIKSLLSEISPWPWCEDYCYEAIRHVQRNCDIECLEHEDLDKCKSFGKYDGSFISKAPEIIDQLLRQNEILRKALEFYSDVYVLYIISQTNCGAHDLPDNKNGIILVDGNAEAKEALKKCDEIEAENE